VVWQQELGRKKSRPGSGAAFWLSRRRRCRSCTSCRSCRICRTGIVRTCRFHRDSRRPDCLERLRSCCLVFSSLCCLNFENTKVAPAAAGAITFRLESLTQFWVYTWSSAFRCAAPVCLNSEGVMPVTFLNWLERCAVLLYSSSSAIWESVISP